MLLPGHKSLSRSGSHQGKQQSPSRRAESRGEVRSPTVVFSACAQGVAEGNQKSAPIRGSTR